jgi:F-type H+-transporting ATPase subunit gamma
VKKKETLRRELASLGMLADAVGAMKSLSAHHLRAARADLQAARVYRDGIGQMLADAGLAQIPTRTDPHAVLVVAADLGLCDGYNARIATAAIEHCQRMSAHAVYVAGRRILPTLAHAGIRPVGTYTPAASAAGLPSALLTLADDVLGAYLEGTFGTLDVVSARFDGVGACSPTITQVLPVIPSARPRGTARTPYVGSAYLRRIAVREYLYSMLYELLVDALASEHGMRLVATQAAGEWLDERVGVVQRQLASVRREASTQEVLEVAAGARLRRRVDA